MTQAVAETIGSLMGEVQSVDKSGSRDCIGRFLRVKIGFNVREPLMRGTFVTFPDNGKIWIDFKYESLPNYCLICGKLGHPTRICREILDERPDPGDCTKKWNEAFAFRGLDAVSYLRGNPLGAGPRSRASSGSHGGQSGSERWNEELGGGRRSGRSSTASGMGCQPQNLDSRSLSGSEFTAPLEEEVIDTATSPSKPRWSSNKMGHRDNVLVGKIRRQRLAEEEARSAREQAFDAGLIGPGGTVAAGAEHVVLNDHYEQEGRVDSVSMTLNGDSTFDLNLVPGVGEDGDSVTARRWEARDGWGGREWVRLG
ncbi:hypothetical protein TB1_005781 [Malus domestica]